jgi:hypothetical protein
MMQLIGYIFFFFGIVAAVAGKDIMIVLGFFIVYGILSGVSELKQIRAELEDWEE